MNQSDRQIINSAIQPPELLLTAYETVALPSILWPPSAEVRLALGLLQHDTLTSYAERPYLPELYHSENTPA